MNYRPAYPRNQDRRRYSRVAVNRGGWLLVGNDKQRIDKIRDLSIGGACIKSKSTFRPGSVCKLELLESGRHSSRAFKLSAEIVRNNHDELALRFVDMDKESYMFLQTMLLYNVEDPISIVSEFQDEFSHSPLSATL